MTDAAVIVTAAGRGERLGLGEPKALLRLGERTMLELAVGAAGACPDIDRIIIVSPPGFEDRMAALGADAAGVPGRVTAVVGGDTRQDSIGCGLAALEERFELVLCHDAARPFATPELFATVVASLSGADAVVPCVPVADTVKRMESGWVAATLPREDLALAQTPQGFRTEVLRLAHRRARSERRTFTDDAALVEWAGFRVRVVPGELGNFKVTTAGDAARATQQAGAR